MPPSLILNKFRNTLPPDCQTQSFTNLYDNRDQLYEKKNDLDQAAAAYVITVLVLRSNFAPGRRTCMVIPVMPIDRAGVNVTLAFVGS